MAGVHSLTENGDSRNEFYVYEERVEDADWSRIGFVAWDYDDLQRPPTRAAEVLQDPLLYGCEMDLDFVIRRDAQLYSRYKGVLRTLLEELLTEEKLIAALQDVRETVQGSTAGVPGRHRWPRVTTGQEECTLSKNVSCPAAGHSWHSSTSPKEKKRRPRLEKRVQIHVGDL